MTEFPKTLAAVQIRERRLRALGDALLEECGPPRSDRASQKLTEVVRILQADGLSFDERTLRQLWNAAWQRQRSRGGSAPITRPS